MGVTVVATASSGGAFEPYKNLLRGEKYTTYIDTSLGTVVMEFADEGASGHAFGGAISAPTAIRTESGRRLAARSHGNHLHFGRCRKLEECPRARGRPGFHERESSRGPPQLEVPACHAQQSTRGSDRDPRIRHRYQRPLLARTHSFQNYFELSNPISNCAAPFAMTVESRPSPALPSRSCPKAGAEAGLPLTTIASPRRPP